MPETLRSVTMLVNVSIAYLVKGVKPEVGDEVIVVMID